MRPMARRVAAVIADCRYAQRRIAVLQANPDASLLRPGQAPDTSTPTTRIEQGFVQRKQGL
jgi:hypothetical protein